MDYCLHVLSELHLVETKHISTYIKIVYNVLISEHVLYQQ